MSMKTIITSQLVSDKHWGQGSENDCVNRGLKNTVWIRDSACSFGYCNDLIVKLCSYFLFSHRTMLTESNNCFNKITYRCLHIKEHGGYEEKFGKTSFFACLKEIMPLTACLIFSQYSAGKNQLKYFGEGYSN